jgi:putative transcriptional regulator
MISMESLKNHFLISMPHMMDLNFARTVVYICEHTTKGAMGLIINRPLLQIPFTDILTQMDIKIPSHNLPEVHFGGPVEIHRGFCLHSSDYKVSDTLVITNNISLTASKTIIEDIANVSGPRNLLFLLGYAGWAEGQLEQEIAENGWLTAPANEKVLFSVSDEDKWKMAAKIVGVDITMMGGMSGNA